MKENRSFYHIISDPVMTSKSLNDKSKLIYALINGLSNEQGYCWANNHYFAEFFGVSKETISRAISLLEKCGFVEIIIDENAGNSRKIFIAENPFLKQEKTKNKEKRVLTKTSRPIDENVKGSYQKHQEVLTKTSRGLDENVKHNNNINIKENIRERETRALDFLKYNYPIRFESEIMKVKSEIKDWKKFCLDFNDTVDGENLFYSDKVLFARFGKYSRNWIQNQEKFSGNEENAKPVYHRKIS